MAFGSRVSGVSWTLRVLDYTPVFGEMRVGIEGQLAKVSLSSPEKLELPERCADSCARS